MAQDIAKKEPNHAINGFVVEKAKEIGLDAPVNKKLVDAVHQVETGAKNQSLDLVASLKLFFCWTDLIDVTTIQIFVTFNIILSNSPV